MGKIIRNKIEYGGGKFPADFGTKAEFEEKKYSLPDGTVFTTTDEFEDLYRTINIETDLSTQLINSEYFKIDDLGFRPVFIRTGNIVILTMRLWCKDVDIPLNSVVKAIDIPNGYKPNRNMHIIPPSSYDNMNAQLLASYTLVNANDNTICVRTLNDNIRNKQLYFPCMVWVTEDDFPN